MPFRCRGLEAVHTSPTYPTRLTGSCSRLTTEPLQQTRCTTSCAQQQQYAQPPRPKSRPGPGDFTLQVLLILRK